MEIRFASHDLPDEGVAVVLAGPDGQLSAAAARLDDRSGGLVRRALATGGESRRHGQILDLFLPAGLGLERLLVVLAGKPEGLARLDIEELGGKIQHKLHVLKVGQAMVASPAGLDLGVPAEEAVAALALGAALRGYRFTRYHAPEGEDENPGVASLTFLAPAGTDTEAATFTASRAVAEAVARARDLVSEPANVLSPEAFAERCRELEQLGVEVELLDQAKLEELGMRALLGVAQGSVRPPYVVVMRWRGAEAEAPVALVGKGVCFDTGGISLKPAQGMEDMKFDMGGAAAVVGAMAALAGRKAKADVVGVIGLAENMPSGTAQRPGDVVRAMSGKTIEVINTDAEGRLLLADVLWYTKERFKPCAMIDLATLTGAIIVALGHEQAGLFATDDELAARLQAAGEAVGEPLWRMPLGKSYDKHIKSAIADIKNVGRAREAGATAGAVFLQHFVGDVPWAHLDIAGVAWTSRDQALAGKGATGYGARLLDRLIADRYEKAG
ncbi:leucyl aminopeptidase [Marinimicrococcus flavescens]|uniref:Probable cytosol aminopeptidase n=1 Tax=Marinimicrococcus flavescens TaxID=3031815 RepID=A0AAP3XQU7_9PROT|nr:leucyl aminopeptidase [Marinimicrococcus flavescens]